MSRKKKTILSNLRCAECQNVTILPRPKGRKRKDGHVKHMWCFKCKKETAHEESKTDYGFATGETEGVGIDGF